MRLLRLHTILVATDLTETSDAALVTAARLAAAADTTLHVVHVTSESRYIVARTRRRSEYESEFRRNLQRANVDLDWQQLHLVGSDMPAAIADVADRVDADVISLGRAGGSQLPTTRPLGGTAYAVIGASAAPCLCVMRPLAVPATRVWSASTPRRPRAGPLVTALSWTSAVRSRGWRATPQR